MHYLALFLCLLTCTVVLSSPRVQLGDTILVGKDVTASKQEFFGGIPFAEPPLGKLRFRPPILKNALDVPTFDASNFGPGCLQPPSPSLSEQYSEDCLKINIFRPAGLSSNATVPVMVYIYGGGFNMGNSASYNATPIVAQSVARGTPIIYVNFNYRVGPLGFPQGREARHQNALNLGLMDQLMALEWVQNHISSFGGDKDKVTVFGQSAGAISVAMLMLNKGFDRHARAVIMQSGSSLAVPMFHPDRNQADWDNFVSSVPECASLSTTDHTFGCLQTANASTIVHALGVARRISANKFPFTPVLDGPGGFLPDQPSKLLNEGKYARLPFITGDCLDEGTLFVGQSTNTTEDIRQWLTNTNSPWPTGPTSLAKVVDRILELYPDDPAAGSPFNTGNETFGLDSKFKQFSAIFNDLTFESQRRYMNQVGSRDGIETFGYLFTDRNAVGRVGSPFSPTVASGSLGVRHSSDLLFLYGHLLGVVSPDVDAFTTQMIDYWVSFATSLTPNDGYGTKRPVWEQYTLQNQVLVQLDSENFTTIPDTHRTKQIAFMNRAFGRRSPGWLNGLLYILQENIPFVSFDRLEL